MRVLIADDDRVFVELTRQRMRALGFDVHVAYDSPTALMAAVRTRPTSSCSISACPAGCRLSS
jgi:DNA-binding response OmpR family regulator